MDTEELEALYSIHYINIDVNGAVLGPSFPVVHDQLLCLTDVEGEVVVLALHCQVSDLLPKGCLIVISDQAYHRRVVGKLNDGVGVVCSHAVLGEQGLQEGTEHAPIGDPCVEGQRGGGVVTFTHTRLLYYPCGDQSIDPHSKSNFP